MTNTLSIRNALSQAKMTDDFRGDDEELLLSIIALVQLNDDKALIPHGIGGHARTLLSAAAVRMLEKASPASA